MSARRRGARRGGALAAVVVAVTVGGCLEYSPHAIPQGESETDVNRKSIERLLAQPAPETIRFGVLGDTQGDFDEAEVAVEWLNGYDDLSFVVQVGDFTHLGTAPEYRVMNKILRELRVPYLVVVGNHDLLANGGDIYDHMYGPRDLAFTYGRTRFVLMDTNGVEYGMDATAPDLAFLRGALADREAYDQPILFAHIDPFNGDFDPALREPYFALLQELGIRVSFYGHGHKPGEPHQRDGSVLQVVGAVDYRTFLVCTVHPDGRIDVERVWF
jgi:3',5'-cyclic AMP phosphodiesterase CpdA